MRVQRLATAVFAVLLLVTGVLSGIVTRPTRAHADDDLSEASRIQIGLAAVPVPLNLHGKNMALVGLGSYIVNVASDCNTCHNSGAPPNFEFAAGFNPYFGQPKKLDPSVYLGGGGDFGPAGLDPGNPGPHIIARNLTPDKTGMPEGGHTLAEFKQIIRTGIDFDHLHPTCTAKITTNCIPPPIDGSRLQGMPWPTYQKMTDHDLDAIYEYLSAIPCIEGPPAPAHSTTTATEPPKKGNRCRATVRQEGVDRREPDTLRALRFRANGPVSKGADVASWK
jgi:hypothetical protein